MRICNRCDFDGAKGEAISFDSRFNKFSIALMRECCDRKMDKMTKTYFMQRARKVPGLSMSRDDIWQKLLAPGSGWVQAQATGKQGQVIRPSIVLRRDYHSLFPSERSDKELTELPEVV